MEKEKFSTQDLYIGSVVRITGRNFSRMDLNNNQPWRETKGIDGLTNNIFVKKDDETYIHLRSGQEAFTFGKTWGEGDVGLDHIKPLEIKLRLGFMINKIQHLELNKEEVLELEKHISQIPYNSETDASLARAFEKFLTTFDKESENE